SYDPDGAPWNKKSEHWPRNVQEIHRERRRVPLVEQLSVFRLNAFYREVAISPNNGFYPALIHQHCGARDRTERLPWRLGVAGALLLCFALFGRHLVRIDCGFYGIAFCPRSRRREDPLLFEIRHSRFLRGTWWKTIHPSVRPQEPHVLHLLYRTPPLPTFYRTIYPSTVKRLTHFLYGSRRC